VVWLPPQLRLHDRNLYWVSCAVGATILAATVGTGFPRTLFPQIFGQWHDAAEAFRDWIVVGICTGLLYLPGVLLLRSLQMPPQNPETFVDHLRYRGLLMFCCAAIGLLVARFIAVRREGLLDDSGARMIGKIFVQALTVSLIYYWFYQGMESIYRLPSVVNVLGVIGQVCVLATGATILWAWAADNRLMRLQAKHHTTGIAGSEPMDLTLTVIGGRESGKTTMMAGAFYEWYTQDLGPLRIMPSTATESDSDAETGEENGEENGEPAEVEDISGGDLRQVAIDLYTHNVLPPGTVSCQDLPFELWLENERVARFNLLDYPGGALVDAAPDPKDVEEFWYRAAKSDGIILVIDMSHARRGQRDDDWLDIMHRYKRVLQLVVERNGKNRVVPVALVLTKVDEYADEEQGQLDLEQLYARFAEFGYDKIEGVWRRLNRKSGPSCIEFSTWLTSAITYSRPARGKNGQPDYTRPFEIAPPPPPIMPSGCASPMLWITSKVMRWNVTLFWDLKSFVFGPSPQRRRHIKAMLELEEQANQRAANPVN
jgi:GTPase SAR1 family protein